MLGACSRWTGGPRSWGGSLYGVVAALDVNDP